MSYKLIRLLKRPLIQQQVNPLPSRKLTRGPLSLTPRSPATLFRDGMASSKLSEFVRV